MDPLKMYFLLKMGIIHCYVSLPEGIYFTLKNDLCIQKKSTPGWDLADCTVGQRYGGGGAIPGIFRETNMVNR